MRVLFIEDSALLQRSVGTALRKSGYAVDVTGEVAAGSTAEFSYRGLYWGATPEDGSGDIVLNAWVVTYE